MGTDDTLTVSDIFTTIAANALAKGGVTDPQWIAALADEHRRAFGDLGIVVPPGGLVGVVADPSEDAPPETPEPPRSVAPPRTPTGRALMLLAALEVEEGPIWIQDVNAHYPGDPGLYTLLTGHQFALVVEWRVTNQRTGVVQFARLIEVWLPAEDDTRDRVQIRLPWFAAFRFSRPICEEAVQTWLTATQTTRPLGGKPSGPWWPQRITRVEGAPAS